MVQREGLIQAQHERGECLNVRKLMRRHIEAMHSPQLLFTLPKPHMQASGTIEKRRHYAHLFRRTKSPRQGRHKDKGVQAGSDVAVEDAAQSQQMPQPKASH